MRVFFLQKKSIKNFLLEELHIQPLLIFNSLWYVKEMNNNNSSIIGIQWDTPRGLDSIKILLYHSSGNRTFPGCFLYFLLVWIFISRDEVVPYAGRFRRVRWFSGGIMGIAPVLWDKYGNGGGNVWVYMCTMFEGRICRYGLMGARPFDAL